MINRHIDKEIIKHLSKKQISLLVGARQVGKTTILHRLKSDLEEKGKPTYFISLEDPKILSLLNEGPENLLNVILPLDTRSRTFVIIDEIQYLEYPSNFLKYHYDTHHEIMKLIVSGSSSFYIDEKFKDSLAGRKRLFHLTTLSLEELIAYRGKAEHLTYLHQGTPLPLVVRRELDPILQEYLIYGGYPEVVMEPDVAEKRKLLAELANAYVKKDALEAKVKHPNVYLLLMRILAEQTGSLMSTHELAGTLGINRLTVESYIHIMQKSFHITLIRPFFRNVRKELTKMPKCYFNDLGLRTHFLRNFEPLAMRSDSGVLFENMVFRRLVDFYEADDIQFWRTPKKQEIDFIIEERRAIEVKLSAQRCKPHTYKPFAASYPKIPLHFIYMDNLLEYRGIGVRSRFA